MNEEKDLEFWIDFINKNEEKETTFELITFYDFKNLFENYINSLKNELVNLIISLKFPFSVKNIEVKVEKKDNYRIIISYNLSDDRYIIDSYLVDKLGVYYVGYSLDDEQVKNFYQENYDFFQKIIPIYYLNNLFYSNCVFYRSYTDDNFGAKLTFSNNNRNKINFSIWRKVSNNTYDYSNTIFDRKYLNHPEFQELYNSILKRITIPISNIKGDFEYLIELAKIDNILLPNNIKKVL